MVYKPTYNWGAPSCMNQFISPVDGRYDAFHYSITVLFALPRAIQSIFINSYTDWIQDIQGTNFAGPQTPAMLMARQSIVLGSAPIQKVGQFSGIG